MSRIIAIANQKGGVGKTTTSVNLTAALQAINLKALLVDLDPQGNATMGSGVSKNEQVLTVNEVLLQKSTIQEAIISKVAAGYDLLPANGALTEAEVVLVKEANAHSRLKLALSKIAKNYDYIILDCPPSLNMLTVNSMAAANSVIIPMQCEYYALEGLSALIGTLEKIKHSVNSSIEIEGIVRTMFDPRSKLALDVSAELQDHFGNKLYKATIPRNIRLAEAPSYGMPINIYDKHSKGARAYLALAKEVHKRLLAKEQRDMLKNKIKKRAVAIKEKS